MSAATTVNHRRYSAATAYGTPGPMVYRAPAPAAASADDVCDLIEAAGPLTVCDIADGLAVPVREAARLVGQLLRAGAARSDEWGRYRLTAAGAR